MPQQIDFDPGVDYYKALGVEKKATPEEIKKAYRKLARQHHPDVNRKPDAEKRFKEINEANEVLSDPEKRKKYDEFGPDWQKYDAWEKAGRPGGSPFGGGANPFGGGTSFNGGPQVEYQTVSPEDLDLLMVTDDPAEAVDRVLAASAAASGPVTSCRPRPRRHRRRMSHRRRSRSRRSRPGRPRK